MIFGWRTIIIVAPIVVFVMWVVKNHPEYEQIFRRPKQTWVKMEWWKVLLVSIPVLILMLKFLPMLENFFQSNVGQMTSNPSQTSQVQVVKQTSKVVGVQWSFVLSGGLFAVVAVFEEVIFRGIVLHWAKRRWNWVVALIFSSLLFGVTHLSEMGFTFPFVAYVVVVGLIFGSLYLRFGLLSSCIAHAGYDFGLMLIVALSL